MKIERQIRRALLFLAVTWLFAGAELPAQLTTAILSGVVTDPAGAAVPGAEITVIDSDTGQHRITITNGTGNYLVADLPYGHYDVKVVKQGFEVLNRTGISLSPGVRQALDLSLILGSTTQAVTVSGVPTALKTSDASMGQLIGHSQVDAMPVLGQTFTQLMYLVPGSQVAPTGQYSGNTTFGSAGPTIGVSFYGMRTEMNDYMIDGVESTYPVYGTPSYYPSMEIIQEMRVEAQNFSTQDSRTAGGQVMLYTKSGTNRFHGSAYDYLRNSALEARNPFSPNNPESRSNLFGGTVGGPILKDNTFFFFGYEGFRSLTPATSSTTVPTAAQLQGNLNDSVLDPNPIINPATGLPFPGNVIPADQLSPIAVNMLKLTPQPNVPGFPNYTANTSNNHPFNEYNVRVDHDFRTLGRLFGRWSYQPGDSDSAPFVVLNPSSTHAVGTNVVVGFDASTSGFSNSVRFGHDRASLISPNIDPHGVTPQSLGFPLDAYQVNPQGQFFGIPNFQISNYAVGFDGFGESGGTPGGDSMRVYQINDTMTLTRGTHTLQWGGDYMRTSVYNIFSGNERGVYTFDGTYTGDPLADFLLGIPRNLNRTTATPEPTLISNSVHGFFSDVWKVSHGLTLNLGLAYAYNGQPYEIANRASTFFIGPVNGVQRIQFVNAGDPRFPRSLMFANTKDIDPRIGIAWQPFGSKKTVVRAGAGIFHSQLTQNDRLNDAFGSPWGVYQGFQNPDPPVATLADAFIPQLITGASSTSENIAAPMDFKDASVYMWNFNIQREIAPGTIVQVGYVGNAAIHLDLLDEFNVAAPGPGPFGPRRPYPLDAGPIVYGTTNANSTYEAFQAQIEKRFGHGWTLLSYYTRAKQLDDASALADGFGSQYYAQDINNIRAEKGRASDDAPNRFVTSFIYEVPVGRGRSFLANSNAVVDGFLGGWRLAGLGTLMSGMPWSATQPGNLANRDFTFQRPNRVCNGWLGSARTLDRFFDTSCYVQTAQYELGNAGRDTIQGPGLVDFDTSIAKSFRVREGLRIEYKADFLNLTNTPYFGKPGNSLGSSTFGEITGLARGGTANTRIIQMALKLVF
jgi:hypothetical protein